MTRALITLWNGDRLMSVKNTKLIQVCDACETAACWYHEFTCQGAQNAGTVLRPVGYLKKLAREHPEYWSATKFFEVYGTTTPDFSGVPTRKKQPPIQLVGSYSTKASLT